MRHLLSGKRRNKDRAVWMKLLNILLSGWWPVESYESASFAQYALSSDPSEL
jgi:hypothetical protein